jgi:hypothetical protein
MAKRFEQKIDNGQEAIAAEMSRAERLIADGIAVRGEKVKKATEELTKLGLSDDTIKLILLGL